MMLDPVAFEYGDRSIVAVDRAGNGNCARLFSPALSSTIFISFDFKKSRRLFMSPKSWGSAGKFAPSNAAEIFVYPRSLRDFMYVLILGIGKLEKT
jgi:hypothetical protein